MVRHAMMKRKISLLAVGLWATALVGSSLAEEAGGSGDMTHRMMMLVIQLGVILFAARLGNMLFERIRLPGVLGELTAGIVIGPYLLGGIGLPGFDGGLFPSGVAFPVSPELYGICAVASVVLLFLVGLETDIRLFVQYSLAGSLVGLGGVAASFAVGSAVTMLFSRMLFGMQLGMLSPPCLMLGIISTATSVGITARILSERRRLDSPEGVTILAGAVVDDVLGIILLAIGLGVISASQGGGAIDWGHIAAIGLKAIGFWLAATTLGLVASRRISVLLKWFKDPSSIATMALGLALILAGLFEEAGLAMIIGAYVVGLSLARSDIANMVRERLHPIHAFLVPVFFTVMGMLVDLRALGSRSVLTFGLVYAIVANLAKIVGCGVPALLCNFNLRGAFRIGIGMMPRGEVTLIIAGVGLAAGVLPAEVFGVVVLTLLLTALVAPPALVAVFSDGRSGVRKDVAKPRGSHVSFNFPSNQAASLLLGKLRNVFESEGFFVSSLTARGQLYQLRKDSIVITMWQSGGDIEFECAERDLPLVNTAMMEVVAELERMVRELRKPVDAGAIARKVQEQGSGGIGRKSLASFLSPSLVKMRLVAETKEAVIDELLEVLDGQGLLTDAKDARRAVWSREESMSTGMQYGIAIPHGRTDAVSQLVCAVGVKQEGLDFESIDGQPSRIFVLTLAPRRAAAPHVQFMSTISQALNERGRDAVLACRSAGDLCDVLTGRKLPEDVMGETAAVKPLPAAARPGGPTLRLADYVRRELLVPELQGSSRDEVIDELLAAVARAGLVSDVAAARAAILEREKEMPTTVGHGVAIPHARTAAASALVCAIGVHREGVRFGEDAAEPSQIVVLTLTPPDAPVPHVQVMAMISRQLDAAGRQRVLAARSRDELWDALCG